MPGVEIEQLVAAIPSPVMAVDEELRVLAWGPKLERDVGLTASCAVGRRCHQAVHLVDAATGRPCSESCPLGTGPPRSGWAHSGALEMVRPDTAPVSVDRLLAQCITPEGSRANLCFLRPPTMESYNGVLRAIEAVYPMTSGPGRPAEVLHRTLDAVLGVTSAVAGEVLAMGPAGGKMDVVACRGLPGEEVREFRQSAVGHRSHGIMSSSTLPLLAEGTWSGEESASGPGWYLSAPLMVERRVLGTVGIASRRDGFDIVMAMRVLFAVAGQLAAYLQTHPVAAGGSRARTGSEDAVAPRLRVYCLGRFRVVADGEAIPISRFRRAKAVMLLKYLAAHRGKPIQREALMELLWPGADPASSRVNLRVVLHDLRRALKAGQANRPSSFVESRGDLVFLDPSDHVWVDAEQLDQKARRASELAAHGRPIDALAEYRAAASLYKGEFLEEEPYRDWCLFERERLKEVYLNILRQMASLLVDEGEIEDAIKCHREALQVDRGREEVHRLLIRLLWNTGRRDEAIRQYERCRRVLWEELDAEPGPETEAARRAMREGLASIG